MTRERAKLEAMKRWPHLHRFELTRGLSREGQNTFYISANQYPRGDYHILGSGASWEEALANAEP